MSNAISDIVVNKEDALMRVKTSTDCVPYTTPYFLKLYNPSIGNYIIDYKLLDQGSLAIKYERTLRQLNFDINSKGELIVIGDDATNYFISIQGEENHGVTHEGGILYYAYQTGGIGEMIIEDTFIII